MEGGKADSGKLEAAGPVMCAGGCGFYGSKDKHGYCSVCFKKTYGSGTPSAPPTPLMAPTKPESLVLGAPALSEPMPTLASATATHVTPPRATSSLATAVETPAPATPAVDETGRKVQKNRNRCFVDTCRKKLEYTGFECRCGYVFCSAHRYADEHNCTHDHKAESATLLKKANPKVVADKFERV